MKEILVSIWCATYNHELYIIDAIKGFLMQKTNFRYEIVFYDDASTDKTADIIREYEQKYPDLIRGIYQTENQYYRRKPRVKWFKELRKRNCRGKYIAHCEGDDCWIDCHKLQIQIEYMEAHPECSMCMHNALLINCQDNRMYAIDPYEGDCEKNLCAEEIIMQYKGHPPTASILYRKDILEMPDFYCETPVGDYPLQLYSFTKGKVHYDSRIMSIYRCYSIGSYGARFMSNKEMAFNHNLGLIFFLIQYDKNTNFKYHIWVINKIQRYITEIINTTNKNIPLRKYCEICEKMGCYFSQGCERYLDKIECLRKQVLDLTFCDEDVREFCAKYSYVVIMGIGEYGEKIAMQFNNNNIEFVGFTVSQYNEGKDAFQEKHVWKLDKIPYDYNDLGVIVAINPINWDDILCSLENAKIKHYICPFLLEY